MLSDFMNKKEIKEMLSGYSQELGFDPATIGTLAAAASAAVGLIKSLIKGTDWLELYSTRNNIDFSKKAIQDISAGKAGYYDFKWYSGQDGLEKLQLIYSLNIVIHAIVIKYYSSKLDQTWDLLGNEITELAKNYLPLAIARTKEGDFNDSDEQLKTMIDLVNAKIQAGKNMNQIITEYMAEVTNYDHSHLKWLPGLKEQSVNKTIPVTPKQKTNISSLKNNILVYLALASAGVYILTSKTKKVYAK